MQSMSMQKMWINLQLSVAMNKYETEVRILHSSIWSKSHFCGVYFVVLTPICGRKISASVI